MTDHTKPIKSKIPPFNSYEEEAAWWDTHDVVDYLSEFEPPKLVQAEKKVTSVYVDDAKKLSNALAIRFDEATSQKLRQIAQKKGIGPTTLGRMLIIEGLDRLEHGRR